MSRLIRGIAFSIYQAWPVLARHRRSFSPTASGEKTPPMSTKNLATVYGPVFYFEAPWGGG